LNHCKRWAIVFPETAATNRDHKSHRTPLGGSKPVAPGSSRAARTHAFWVSAQVEAGHARRGPSKAPQQHLDVVPRAAFMGCVDGAHQLPLIAGSRAAQPDVRCCRRHSFGTWKVRIASPPRAALLASTSTWAQAAAVQAERVAAASAARISAPGTARLIRVILLWPFGNPVTSICQQPGRTRIWVYNGNGAPSDLGGGDFPFPDIERAALANNLALRDKYVAAGGTNGVFNFPDTGTHTWAYWGRELQAMKPDLQRVLGARSGS
jgi:hypothetical protein